jgi:hypothetical protein
LINSSDQRTLDSGAAKIMAGMKSKNITTLEIDSLYGKIVGRIMPKTNKIIPWQTTISERALKTVAIR